MPERTTARDLMADAFRRIDESLTVRAAMLLLLSGEERSRILMAVGDGGSFAGVLTPRLMLRGLLGDWATAAGEGRHVAERGFREAMLDAVRGRLEDPVRSILAHDVPQAAPEESLLRLMELIGDERLDCVPVVEDGRVAGIVRSADVFQAAAELALAPGTAEPSEE